MAEACGFRLEAPNELGVVLAIAVGRDQTQQAPLCAPAGHKGTDPGDALDQAFPLEGL